MSVKERAHRLARMLVGVCESAHESRAEVLGFVRQLVHDLTSPVGAFTMEIYTMEGVLSRLERALIDGDTASARAEAQTLREIHENLVLASETARGYLTALDEAAGPPQ